MAAQREIPEDSPVQTAWNFLSTLPTPVNEAGYVTDLETIQTYGLSFLYQNMAIDAILYQIYAKTLNDEYFIPFSQNVAIQKGFVQGYLDTFNSLIPSDPFPDGASYYKMAATVDLWNALNATPMGDIAAKISALEAQIPTSEPANTWWTAMCNTLNNDWSNYQGTNDPTLLGILQGTSSFLYLLYQQITFSSPGYFPPGGGHYINPGDDGSLFCYALGVFQAYPAANYWATQYLSDVSNVYDHALPNSFTYYYQNTWAVPNPNGDSNYNMDWLNRIFMVITGNLAVGQALYNGNTQQYFYSDGSILFGFEAVPASDFPPTSAFQNQVAPGPAIGSTMQNYINHCPQYVSDLNNNFTSPGYIQAYISNLLPEIVSLNQAILSYYETWLNSLPKS